MGYDESAQQHQLPTTPLLIDGASVDPAKSVRDLGIYIDADLVMRTHVQRTVSRCFAALRQLRQIRRSLPPITFRSLVVSLVISRLNYGNAVLVGLPAYLLRRLQSVLNAAEQVIDHMRSADHITDALISFQWLHVPQRIDYKIAVLTCKHYMEVAAIFGSAGLCRRSIWPSDTTFCQHKSPVRAFRQALYRRYSGIRGRWSSNLERLAKEDNVSSVADVIPSATKVVPLCEIISGHRHLICFV